MGFFTIIMQYYYVYNVCVIYNRAGGGREGWEQSNCEWERGRVIYQA